MAMETGKFSILLMLDCSETFDTIDHGELLTYPYAIVGIHGPTIIPFQQCSEWKYVESHRDLHYPICFSICKRTLGEVARHTEAQALANIVNEYR